MDVEPGGPERGRRFPTAKVISALFAGCLPFAVPETVFSFGSTASRIGVGLLGAGLVVLASAVPAARSAIRSGAWRRAWSRGTRAATLRILLYGACGGIVACSVVPLPAGSDVAGDAMEALFRGGMCLGLGSAIQIVLPRIGRPDATRRGTAARIADLAAWNVLATLIVAEAVLLLMARFSPSPWLYEDATAERFVDAHRLDPRVSTDMRINSGGFHDDDFFVAGPRDHVTALVGDSFGMGVVPWEFTFATVAEDVLKPRLAAAHERVAVHNVSINASGMREYRYLLEREALPLRPKRIVLCAYVGNDLFCDFGTSRDDSCRRHLRVQNWSVCIAASNVVSSLMSVERFGFAPRRPDSGVPPRFEDEMRRSQSNPSFTEARYRDVVRERSQVARPDGEVFERWYAAFFVELEEFVRSAGPDVLILVAPDEFQVNDAVHEQLVESLGDEAAGLDRDVPQRRIRAWCESRGVACLDVLPVLRAAERIRPTYVPRDTHWNAWGNLVVGRALATALLDGVEAVRIDDCLADPPP